MRSGASSSWSPAWRIGSGVSEPSRRPRRPLLLRGADPVWLRSIGRGWVLGRHAGSHPHYDRLRGRALAPRSGQTSRGRPCVRRPVGRTRDPEARRGRRLLARRRAQGALGSELRGGRRAARGDGRRRTGRSPLVLLPGCERLRSVRRAQRHDLPAAERQDGYPLRPTEGPPRGGRIRGAAAGGPRPRERALGRADDRAPALDGVPARRHREVASGLRGQSAPDRRHGDGLVEDRGRAAPPPGRDDGARDVGCPGRRRIRDDAPPRAGPPRHLPHPAGTRLEQERRGGRRVRWKEPACTVACIGRRPCASSTSRATRV